MAGAIDSMLGLNARAKRLRDLLDPAFVREQAAKVCSHCGAFMGYNKQLQVKEYKGTPMSDSYLQALQKGTS